MSLVFLWKNVYFFRNRQRIPKDSLNFLNSNKKQTNKQISSVWSVYLFKTPSPRASSEVSSVFRVFQGPNGLFSNAPPQKNLCSLLSSNVTLLSVRLLSSLIHTHLPEPRTHSKDPWCSSPTPSLPPSLPHTLLLLLILSLLLKEQCTNLTLRL